FASPDLTSVSLQELKAVLSPGGTLAGKGELRAGSAQFDLQVAELDLRSLRSSLRSTRLAGSLRLEHFDPASFGDYPAGDINGSLEGAGTLGADAALDARWQIRDSTLEGAALESRGAARVSRTRASRVDAQASLGGALLTARGDFGGRGDELRWDLQVARI